MTPADLESAHRYFSKLLDQEEVDDEPATFALAALRQVRVAQLLVQEWFDWPDSHTAHTLVDPRYFASKLRDVVGSGAAPPATVDPVPLPAKPGYRSILVSEIALAQASWLPLAYQELRIEARPLGSQTWTDVTHSVGAILKDVAQSQAAFAPSTTVVP